MRNVNLHLVSPTRKAALVRWHKSCERGSMDGGSFGDIIHIPFLIGMLVVGILFAMIGFWRVGASYSAQVSAQAGSVAPNEGDGMLTGWWSIWSGDDSTPGDFNVNSGDRAVRSNINTSEDFDFLGFGPWHFTIDAQAQSRSERFYPGQPVCDADGCDE